MSIRNKLLEDILAATTASEFQTQLVAASFSQQQPTGTDSPLQVEFGAAQGTGSDPVQLSSSGTVTINETRFYSITASFSLSRTTAVGESFLFIRLLINDVQDEEPIAAVMTDDNMTIPLQLNRVGIFTSGTEIKVEVIIDSSGIDNGGLSSFSATAPGWGSSASASLRIETF